MRKILLTSTGFENKNIEKKFLELLNKRADEAKVLFIITAAIDPDAVRILSVCLDDLTNSGIKDEENKLWIIDFAVSNYLPRIIDLVVTGDNLCLDFNNKENTIRNFKLIISEYEKYNKLTDYEKELIPLFYDIGNAMGILQINALKQDTEHSEEDEYWLKVSEQGLKVLVNKTSYE